MVFEHLTNGTADNSIFTGPWGRPQNDGPATAAITLMEFANTYMANGGNLSMVKSRIYDSTANPSMAPVMKDLLFVASNWSSTSFDLWEEESSDHFYTVSSCDHHSQYQPLVTLYAAYGTASCSCSRVELCNKYGRFRYLNHVVERCHSLSGHNGPILGQHKKPHSL